MCVCRGVCVNEVGFSDEHDDDDDDDDDDGAFKSMDALKTFELAD
jgi:hypothetical protein